jgi:hypothetical protein
MNWRDRWDSFLARHRNDPWVEPERPPGRTYPWTRAWMFTLGRKLRHVLATQEPVPN